MKTRVIRAIYGLAILAVLMLFTVNPVRATTWTEGHHEIFDGDTYWETYIHNDVTLDIFGGDIYRLDAYDTTLTNWYGGQMDTLRARDDSIINIYGGNLWTFAGTENSLANLYAYDVLITHTGGFWDDGQVFGKFCADDSSFSFDLWGDNSYLHINIVPEPTSLLLLSLGGLLLRSDCSLHKDSFLV